MKDELLKLLRPAGQEHLLAFWDELDESSRAKLGQQIQTLDLPMISQLCSNQSEEGGHTNWSELAARAEAPPAFRLGQVEGEPTADRARSDGETALRQGKLGMILVAGGQGTRLSFDHPKGMYQLGPVSGRSLFQIIIEQLLAVSGRFGVRIPLYLMTSPATDNETREFLQTHDRFGLAEEDLRIFCQGTMPAVDQQGRILLDQKDSLSLSPDGHGGMLLALVKSGCLQDAKDRGLEHLFYGQVDNPLVQICDPTLIGYHRLSGSEMTTQVVAKAGPKERVGNVVSVDGQVRIIEYSDLPEDVAQQRNPDDSLRLWAGNIAVHLFELEFLDRTSRQATALPSHRAHKTVPYVDESGERVRPADANAIKFEKFIFDLLPLAKDAIVVEADRARAFAPVKNANDQPSDTPRIAQDLMVAEHARWLREAGAEVGSGVKVEICPLYALDAQQLKDKLGPGLKVTEDTFFN